MPRTAPGAGAAETCVEARRAGHLLKVLGGHRVDFRQGRLHAIRPALEFRAQLRHLGFYASHKSCQLFEILSFRHNVRLLR
jgi:hypothetical protein